MREEMLALYMKVYGSFMATNNEFMKWFMKGYIAKKTWFVINWVAVAANIAREKTRWEELEKFKTKLGEQLNEFLLILVILSRKHFCYFCSSH